MVDWKELWQMSYDYFEVVMLVIVMVWVYPTLSLGYHFLCNFGSWFNNRRFFKPIKGRTPKSFRAPTLELAEAPLVQNQADARTLTSSGFVIKGRVTEDALLPAAKEEVGALRAQGTGIRGEGYVQIINGYAGIDFAIVPGVGWAVLGFRSTPGQPGLGACSEWEKEDWERRLEVLSAEKTQELREERMQKYLPMIQEMVHPTTGERFVLEQHDSREALRFWRDIISRDGLTKDGLDDGIDRVQVVMLSPSVEQPELMQSFAKAQSIKETEAAAAEEEAPTEGLVGTIKERLNGIVMWLAKPKIGTGLTACLALVKIATDVSVILRYSTKGRPWIDIALYSLAIPRGVLAVQCIMGRAETLPPGADDEKRSRYQISRSREFGHAIEPGKEVDEKELFDRWLFRPGSQDPLANEAFASLGGYLVRMDEAHQRMNVTPTQTAPLRDCKRRALHAASIMVSMEALEIRRDSNTWEKPRQRDKWLATKIAASLFEAVPQAFLRSYLAYEEVANESSRWIITFAFFRVVFTVTMLTSSVASYRATRFPVHCTLLMGETLKALGYTICEIVARFFVWSGIYVFAASLAREGEAQEWGVMFVPIICVVLFLPVTCIRMLFLNGSYFARTAAHYSINALMISVVIISCFLIGMPEDKIEQQEHYSLVGMGVSLAFPLLAVLVVTVGNCFEMAWIVPGASPSFPYVWALLCNMIVFTGVGHQLTHNRARVLSTRIWRQLTLCDIAATVYQSFACSIMFIYLVGDAENKNPLEKLSSVFFVMMLAAVIVQVFLAIAILVLSRVQASTAILWSTFFAEESEFEHDKGAVLNTTFKLHRGFLMLLMIITLVGVLLSGSSGEIVFFEYSAVAAMILYAETFFELSNPIFACFLSDEHTHRKAIDALTEEQSTSDFDRTVEEVLQNIEI